MKNLWGQIKVNIGDKKLCAGIKQIIAKSHWTTFLNKNEIRILNIP